MKKNPDRTDSGVEPNDSESLTRRSLLRTALGAVIAGPVLAIPAIAGATPKPPPRTKKPVA